MLFRKIALFTIIISKLISQPISVSGIVKNENGEPLVGANVFIEGTTLGVPTDASGKYEIQKSKEDFYKAEFEQISLEQLIFLDAIKVYIDLLYNIDLLELKTKNENIIEEELKSARIQFQLGDIKKSDLLLAEAIYKKAIIDISDINKNIINLKTTFKNEIQMKFKNKK